ncbi:TBC1 domain family member 5 [Bagarius yarrelli]|uniref:TBC1 domain family member 5 n=1 Tax=Bagarius yarrelli TaxID=175774 RepID=A0A556U8R0_BAGYA|nr:TBC1 domain family member 5 [Bagarius yarrelli]
MQSSHFETRHPLQAEEQETGYDPLHNYNQSFTQWDELFQNSNYLARIRQSGINGQLRSSRFRSICWKLYLDILPEDKSQWIKKTKELRDHYEQIKERHITNPRKAAGQQDLVVNNPLSQDEGSLWNKFFQDKELRGMITQDVLRTFPEMHFFQEEDVRTKLTDILFCYARENEQLLYKQGMHELLAPIVFVLHSDHQAFQHACETGTPSAMFSQLMETAEPWFSSFEREVRKGKEEMLTSIPFARPQDTGPRWVRLLFGREFLLQDLLVVWDALLADSITLDLVDYVFVAMLLYIRDALIASSFQTCLGLLMHYPPVGDIHALLHKALFLRDPKNNPRPVNYQFQQNLDYYKNHGADFVDRTRAASNKVAPININKVSSSLLSFGRKLIAPMGGGSSGVLPINSEVMSSSLSPQPPPTQALAEQPSNNASCRTQMHVAQQRLLKSESMPVHLSKGQTSRTVSSSPSVESLSGGRDQAMSSPPLSASKGRDSSTSSPPLSATKKDLFFNISRSRSHSKSIGKKDLEELEAQVSLLQGQINDLEAMSKYCAKMMNMHIGKIQNVILQEHLQKEDEVLVSLAGLKQIKDILKGALRFNQSQLEAEENEEITIADDHYCSTAQNSAQQDGSTILANIDTKFVTPGLQPDVSHLSEHNKEMKTREKTAMPSEGTHTTEPQIVEGRNWDDYILISQDGDLHPSEGEVPLKAAQGFGMPEFQDPLMATTSGSSSPDEGSTNSKDSDFTIVNPADL